MKILPQLTAGGKRLITWPMRTAGYTISRIEPQTKLVCPNIPGWFSVVEAEALYLLAATTTARRMLEVGHYLGRSTSAICEGIRDAGSTPEFNSFDLGFANADEFIAHYKKVHNHCSAAVPLEYERMVFAQNKSTTEIAKAHLSRFHLDGFVNLISGDFTVLSRGQYGFIFCDAMHDKEEIAVNLPHVIAASTDDCVWAIHDMSAANIAEVLRGSSARLIRVVDTLGIFRFENKTI